MRLDRFTLVTCLVVTCPCFAAGQGGPDPEGIQVDLTGSYLVATLDATLEVVDRAREASKDEAHRKALESASELLRSRLKDVRDGLRTRGSSPRGEEVLGSLTADIIKAAEGRGDEPLPVDSVDRAERIAALAGAAELTGVYGSLQGIRGAIDSVLGQADDMARERLRQAGIEVDAALDKVKEVIDDGYKKANITREELFDKAFASVATTSKAIQDQNRLLFLHVNASIANLARVADSLPFIKVDPYVFAISPVRTQPSPSDRTVFFHGYFANTLGGTDGPKVELDGTTLPLTPYEGGKLGFEVPLELLKKESSFINMTVHVWRGKFLFGKKEFTFASRLYVEKAEPFSFTVKVLKENPSFRAQLVGRDEFRSNHDANLAASANDIFSRSINDDASYVMATAQLTSVGPVAVGGGKPCECCPGYGASVTRWNAASVEMHLDAPYCTGRTCGSGFGTYWCGGGGSNVAFVVDFGFSVQRRGQSEEVPAELYSLTAARDSIKKQDIPSHWVGIDIVGRFEDGDERYEQHTILRRNAPVHAHPLWAARIDSGSLAFQTRSAFPTP
jgi:hypothetical protein